jgi:fluoride ion exporter CrcB/FEX
MSHAPEERGPWPWSLAAVAFVGGTCGSLVRALVQRSFNRGGLPAWGAHATVNVAGSFAIGMLFAALVARDARGEPVGIPSERRIREHLLGAGVLGGLTTVSGLAQDLCVLVGGGQASAAAASIALNGFAGLVACAAGYRAGTLVRRKSGAATLR